jgi:Ca-activated chloride channel homolog
MSNAKQTKTAMAHRVRGLLAWAAKWFLGREQRLGLCILSFLTLTLAAFAQRPAFKTQTDLVAVAVTVVGADGRPVQGLGKDAFSLTEDDRPQPIVQFTGDAVPLSLAIALDASTSMKGRRFQWARDAVWRLLDHLAPKDEVCVYGFNDQPFVIAPWTSDIHTVERSLLGVSPDGNTALYSTVSSVLGALATSQHRRQAMVVISDGNDRLASDNPMYRGPASTSPLDVAPGPDPLSPSRQRLIPLLERIRHSEALIYAIGIDLPNRYGHDPLDHAALRQLTDPTGGFTEIVHADADAVTVAERIAAELRHQYLLGFVPAHADDGRFHRVGVTVTCPCQVRARAGFIADKRKGPEGQNFRARPDV